MDFSEFKKTFDVPNSLTIEFHYLGHKIDNPKEFFEKHHTIFKQEFPSREKFLFEIERNQKFKETHKLVVSENGFNLVSL